MKKILVLFVLGLSLSAYSTETNNDFNFVGKWLGKDKEGAVGGFLFDKEGYVSFIMNGNVVGGKGSELSGMTVIMKYNIDQTTTPIQFDINIEAGGTTTKRFLIIKIINSNTIVVAQSEEGKEDIRPTEFTNDNSITLTRA